MLSSSEKKAFAIHHWNQPFPLAEVYVAAFADMKVDFAWPIPLVNTVTYDRQFLSPSSSCPLKISLSLHPQTSKVILRCASAALADPRTALTSSLFSVSLPCQAEKPIYCMSAAKALSSPSFSIVCTPTTTAIQEHAWTHTHFHIHTHWQKLAGEPVKIWVAQQEQGVWIYSDWCSELTFSDNGWEIMEKADIQAGNIAAAAWCLQWSWRQVWWCYILRSNCGCDLLCNSLDIIIKSMVFRWALAWLQINVWRIFHLK